MHLPPPAWGVKSFGKAFAGGGQKFLFWWGELYCWGRVILLEAMVGSENFEGKLKIA